jgi:hypothetical protein
MAIFDEALAAGYDEIQAKAIEQTIANRLKGGESAECLLNYSAWHEGNYIAAQGGDFTVAPADVSQTARAVDIKYRVGVPAGLKDGHYSKIALGTMPAARVDENNKMRAAIVGDWMTINGLRNGTLTLSIEADRDYSSEAYTAGEEFKYWPTAWAVLPVGEQPAVPPGEPLAASEETKKPVRLYAHETAPDGGICPEERGRDTMTPDEMTKKLADIEAAQGDAATKTSELEATIADLTAKLAAANKELDDMKGEKEAVQVAAAEKAVEDRTKILLASEQRPGIREKISGKLAAAEGHAAKAVLLDAFESMVDETELVAARLHASEAKPVETKTDADSVMDDAEKIQAAEKCSWNEALKAADRKKKEGE